MAHQASCKLWQRCKLNTACPCTCRFIKNQSYNMLTIYNLNFKNNSSLTEELKKWAGSISRASPQSLLHGVTVTWTWQNKSIVVFKL